MAYEPITGSNAPIVFGDPTDPTAPDVRVTRTTANKSIGGKAVTNHRTEVKILSFPVVDVDGADAVDTVSVYLRVSGSRYADAELGQILSGLATLLPAWHSEKVFGGFDPDTLPAFPVIA